ncbi:MAG: hypothetical protein ACXV8I_01120 [Methylobacter sp.]
MNAADIAIRVESLSITKLQDKWCLTPFFRVELDAMNAIPEDTIDYVVMEKSNKVKGRTV